jgi:hypothetical protein
MQKLLVLQRWHRYRLGDCFHTRTDDQGQGEGAAHPIGHLRRLYMLGVGDDCSIHLSAAKALDVEPLPRVTSPTTPSE